MRGRVAERRRGALLGAVGIGLAYYRGRLRARQRMPQSDVPSSTHDRNRVGTYQRLHESQARHVSVIDIRIRSMQSLRDSMSQCEVDRRLFVRSDPLSR